MHALRFQDEQRLLMTGDGVVGHTVAYLSWLELIKAAASIITARRAQGHDDA
jgi:hypothetical protein